jgi:2-iminoacetate synthase
METCDYVPLVAAGADGLVVYQETYDRSLYAELHTAGPKRDFNWRLETPERAYAAGFRRLGIGALYGLADWRMEALSVAAHATYLLRQCWKAQLTISLPRLRPCAGEFQPRTGMSDRELVQLVCAFRLMFPDVGLVLSTREPRLVAGWADSAGHHADERRQSHRTGRLHRCGSRETASHRAGAHRRIGRERMGGNPGIAPAATRQFEVADVRSAAEVAERIRRLGYEPVWKDWDQGLGGPAEAIRARQIAAGVRGGVNPRVL